MGRVPERLEVPLEYYESELGSSGFAVEQVGPVPGWSEGVAYRESDDTLYIPDLLGTAPLYTVGPERLGFFLLCRPKPPFEAFTGLDPSRVLVGHGTGLFDDPAGRLVTALSNARGGFARALLEHGPTQFLALVDALGD